MRQLVVGIRAVNKLDYSPLIVTSDARSWSPAGPIGALADEPDALAISGRRRGDGPRRVTGVPPGCSLSPGRLASWRQIATETGLARSPAGRFVARSRLRPSVTWPGRRSSGRAVAATASSASSPCASATWRLVGPRPAAVVAQLDCRSAGSAGGQWRPVCARRSHRRGLRRASRRVHQRQRAEMACLAGDVDCRAATRGLLRPGGSPRAVRLDLRLSRRASPRGLGSDRKRRWRRLPSPPARTAVVVFDPAGRVDALAADDTSFTDWSACRRCQLEEGAANPRADPVRVVGLIRR